MVDQAFYQNDTGCRLLEHYAKQYVESYPQFDLPTARAIVDTHPAMQGLLGRGSDACAYEKALVLAGLATEEEQAKVDAAHAAQEAEWERLAAERAEAAEHDTRIDPNPGGAEYPWPEGASEPQPEPTGKPKVGEFEWQGEVLDLDPEVGYTLLAEYRTAAAALHEAKRAAKAVEEKIMKTLGGYEHGAVDGQQVFHWPWVDSTSFNSKAFKEDPKRKALYDSFLETKQTRRFRVEGTVGVD